MKWSFGSVWNESLEQREERPLKPRDYIYASELGGSYIDRFLKMKGEPASNPPNARSLRKFEAGNMMEWVIELVLRRAGILQEKGSWYEFCYDGFLPVHGRLDFLAGGHPDWDKALQEVQALNLPEFFNRATHRIINHFKEKYPDGLEQVVLEVKSCSTFMFERYEKYGVSLTNSQHAMQLFHYLKALPNEEGHLVYICKDDLRILELGVFNPSHVEAWYREDIETMSKYFQADVMPSKEPEIVFNEDSFKFSTNWKVEYSNYLTRLYGYETPEHYRETWGKTIERWNRTFIRCVQEKKMTDLNLQTIEEIQKYFPNFEQLVEKAKEKIDIIKEDKDEVE